jgi:hypothetical protein
MITIQAIRSGGGIEAYNRYIVTSKAIADHYGHKADILSPDYFGIGKQKGGGSGNKSDYYLYGDSEQVIEVPAWAMKTSKSREDYISKDYPDLYVQGSRLKRAGTTGGTDMNDYQNVQTRLAQKELKAYDQSDANAMVNENDGYFTSTKAAREKNK